MLVPAGAQASDLINPFFGDNKHQFQLSLGQGFDSGELILVKHLDRPVPYYMAALSYSQPNTFFSLPGRQTINLIKTLGFGRGDYNGGCRYDRCDWKKYGAEIFMLSQDFAIAPYNGRVYFGTGAGLAVQGKYNERLNTKFLLGFRVFVGYRITGQWNLELIAQHFSNGDTGTENGVYNFYALGVSYSF